MGLLCFTLFMIKNNKNTKKNGKLKWYTKTTLIWTCRFLQCAIILLILYLSQNNISPNHGTLLKSVFNPKLLKNLFACCSLINLFFLLLNTTQRAEFIILPLFCLSLLVLSLFHYLLDFYFLCTFYIEKNILYFFILSIQSKFSNILVVSYFLNIFFISTTTLCIASRKN